VTGVQTWCSSDLDQKAKLEKEYENIKSGVLDMLKQDFRPEFLNRIDKIIVFRPLGFEELRKITHLQISYLQNRLLEQGVQLRVTTAAVKFITDKSFDPAQGARFVRKNIQDLLEDPLAEKIIEGSAKEGVKITADARGDKITFAISRAEKVAVPV
jgi:ATP-dependent Clp protease ATP-binding subunit ClpA